jgi:hypothetical protein
LCGHCNQVPSCGPSSLGMEYCAMTEGELKAHTSNKARGKKAVLMGRR